MDVEKEIERRFQLQEEFLGTDKPVNKMLPLVTVRTITYQHADFIEDCIKGVLMQRTNFPFEFIIGEDGSTDGTREICERYAREHPDKIRLFVRDRELTQLYDENGNFIRRLNGLFTIKSSRGKYMAICEGDDYWTDPLKLQKQVDFLEAHPDCGLVHTDYDLFYVAENRTVRSACESFWSMRTSYEDREQLFDMLIEGSYPILAATTMFRKSLYNAVRKQIDEVDGQFLLGDTVVWLEMSRLTEFHYINEVCVTYRVLPESASHSKSIEKQLRFNLSRVEMGVYFEKKYRTDISISLRRRYNKTLILYKTYVPNYVEQYPLVRPGVVERFFYKVPYPGIRLSVRMWFWLLFIKDHGIYNAVCLLIQKTKLWIVLHLGSDHSQ
jgi:glycosyltransferase involved in cell wall biosynthesis